MGTYSAAWHRLIGSAVPGEQTALETAFLSRVLPFPAFRRVLDVPCGSGRHAAALGMLGYDVTGVELDTEVAAAARGRAPAATVLVGDIRRLTMSRGAFDAVICLWASFGYWDDATNRDVLAGLAERLRTGGLLVLDLYDPAFFRAQDGEVTRQIASGVVERRRVLADRLHVELEYDGRERDRFEWRLYRPDELGGLVTSLALKLACCGWDERRRPEGTLPRYQLVLERRS